MIKGVEGIVISGLIKDEEMMRESCRMRNLDKVMKREREIKKRRWIGLEQESNFLEKYSQLSTTVNLMPINILITILFLLLREYFIS